MIKYIVWGLVEKVTNKFMEVTKVYKRNNKKILYALAIIIFVIYIGFLFTYYGLILKKIMVNVMQSNSHIQQYKKMKNNTSYRDHDITAVIKSISANTERVLIVVDVNKENLNSTRIPEFEDEFIKLTDQNGKQYELLAWGGACEGNKRTDNVEETKLEFQGVQEDNKFLVLTIRKIDGILGEWQFKLPVDVVKPNTHNIDVKYSENGTTCLIKKVTFSGSIIKVQGKFSTENHSKGIVWTSSKLEINNKKINMSEGYGGDNASGDFIIVFPSNEMNGNLTLILYWNDYTKIEIPIPIKS